MKFYSSNPEFFMRSNFREGVRFVSPCWLGLNYPTTKSGSDLSPLEKLNFRANTIFEKSLNQKGTYLHQKTLFYCSKAFVICISKENLQFSAILKSLRF